MKKNEKQNNCKHKKTIEIENYDFCYRGRIDAVQCTECKEIVSQSIIR